MVPFSRNVGRHTAEVSRRVKFFDVNAHGQLREAAGTREAELEIVVDVDRLVRLLAEKAILSSGRKSKLAGGAVLLRVVKGTEKNNVTPHVHSPRCYDCQGVLSCGCKEGV